MKKANIPIKDIVDGLLKILKKYPIQNNQINLQNSKNNNVLNPEIIISESFS